MVLLCLCRFEIVVEFLLEFPIPVFWETSKPTGLEEHIEPALKYSDTGHESSMPVQGTAYQTQFQGFERIFSPDSDIFYWNPSWSGIFPSGSIHKNAGKTK